MHMYLPEIPGSDPAVGTLQRAATQPRALAQSCRHLTIAMCHLPGRSGRNLALIRTNCNFSKLHLFRSRKPYFLPLSCLEHFLYFRHTVNPRDNCRLSSCGPSSSRLQFSLCIQQRRKAWVALSWSCPLATPLLRAAFSPLTPVGAAQPPRWMRDGCRGHRSTRRKWS